MEEPVFSFPTLEDFEDNYERGRVPETRLAICKISIYHAMPVTEEGRFTTCIENHRDYRICIWKGESKSDNCERKGETKSVDKTILEQEDSESQLYVRAEIGYM